MGVYFNPKNESFTKDRNYKIYLDKTGLLEYLNESIGIVLLSAMPDALVSHMRQE